MKSLRTLIAVSLLLLLPAFAHAQLELILGAAQQAGTRGDTLVFEGIITNTGDSTLFFSGSSFTLDGDGLTFDDTPFFVDGPLLLNAGEFFTGPLFNVIIEENAPNQTSLGSFTVLGGAVEGDQNELATATFTVTVAPEPASGLLVVGAMLIVGRTLRRKK